MFARRAFSILAIVFLANGLGLLVAVGIMIFGDCEKIWNGERVEGVVVQARDNEKPTVEFRTKDGRRMLVEGAISASPTPYEVGERIGVFYDPANPTGALIDSFLERWFLPLIFGGFATIFTLVGFGFMLAVLRRRRQQNRLMRSGMRAQGIVAGFEQNRFTKINGRRPWHVIVDWTDPKGQPRRERSEMLREDPARIFKVGDTVAVLADPANAKLFWIDLDGRSKGMQTGFGGTSGNVSTGVNVGGLGKSGTNPVVRRR